MLDDVTYEFQRHRRLAESAIAQLDDSQFFQRPNPVVNSVALIMKHVAGNLNSRWTDFLSSDGDKPSRDRDSEFVLTDEDTRQHLTALWQQGWSALLRTLGKLTESDLDRMVTIRGERHSVRQAVLRGLTHTVYHIGQILYLVRLLSPDGRWLTIAPGASRAHTENYLQSPGPKPH